MKNKGIKIGVVFLLLFALLSVAGCQQEDVVIVGAEPGQPGPTSGQLRISFAPVSSSASIKLSPNITINDLSLSADMSFTVTNTDTNATTVLTGVVIDADPAFTHAEFDANGSALSTTRVSLLIPYTLEPGNYKVTAVTGSINFLSHDKAGNDIAASHSPSLANEGIKNTFTIAAPELTPTPEPTATPTVEPTATPTAEPTATPTAEPTATPTAEPTAAPTPTPEPEANPLTGEQGDYTNQRPVAVSIRTGDGSTPQWGIAAADVLIEGVTEGKTAGLTAVFASVDSVEKAGPVAPGRDLPLQLVLPLNAVPVHINKSVYASNLLNVLQYQDLDGYHAGTAGFAFDEDRANSGYREENCWYTTKDLINTGLATYNTDTAGANMPLFHFVQRKDPEQQNAKSLYITFSNKDTEELVYSPEVGLYLKNNADGSPMMDAGNNEQAAFTNVFVLYASSGVKDDGVTRQYDLTGGTGIYLTKGGWETIQWTKGDATAPLQLTDASGKTLDVNPGKSFLAIWGGYYGQALRLLDGDGNEQALPEKPALLDSAVPDEAAEAAEQAQQHAQALVDAQDKLNQAQTALNEALQAQQDAAGTADSSDDDAASQRVAEAQAAYDAAAAELAALQPAEETDGNTEPAADSAEEPQSEPDSANGENAG